MIITIWRHGEAGRAITDQQRELTGQGKDDISFGVHQFAQQCQLRGIVEPDLLLYSPWIRTTQTAEIISPAFNHAAMEPEEGLIPGASPADVDAALERVGANAELARHIVLVSHQPLVSRLIDYYLGEWGMVPSLCPGSFAVLEAEVAAAGSASLCFWAMPPEYEAGI
jgi:phosphohistidine phosphatase